MSVPLQPYHCEAAAVLCATEEMASQSIPKSADEPEGLDHCASSTDVLRMAQETARLLVPNSLLASCKDTSRPSHPQNCYYAASNSPEDSSKGFAALPEAHAQDAAAGDCSLARDPP